MQTTIIKWNEAMMARCLAKWADIYREPAAVEKHIPVSTAENEFSFKLDIPALSPPPKVKETKEVKEPKKDGWDDFKKAVSKYR